MAQLVQLDKQATDIAQLFKINQQRMIRASPKNVDPARLLAIAFNAIAYNTDLLQCTRASLIGGVFEALKLGLTLGGAMQEAWLIPFNDNRTGTKVATFIVGYQGYRNLIDRSRATLDLHPRAVHNGVGRKDGIEDEFDYWFGDNPKIVHRPKGPAPDKEPQLRCVYAVARLRGGGMQMEVLEKEEVDQHRARSRAKSSGPWVTDYVAMALKTSIRKISKYLPKASLEMAKALQLDEDADLGKDQAFDLEGLIIDVESTPGANAPQPQRGLEATKERLRTEQGKQPQPEPAKTTEPPAEGDIKWS